MEDHVESSSFLADEEDVLSPGHKVGDQVGDRLALSCARRPLDDIAVAGPALQDGPGLGRVGGDYMEPVFGVVAVKRVLRVDPRLPAEKGIEADMLDLPVDDGIVIPHETHLLVIEITQHHMAEIEI